MLVPNRFRIGQTVYCKSRKDNAIVVGMQAAAAWLESIGWISISTNDVRISDNCQWEWDFEDDDCWLYKPIYTVRFRNQKVRYTYPEFLKMNNIEDDATAFLIYAETAPLNTLVHTKEEDLHEIDN